MIIDIKTGNKNKTRGVSKFAVVKILFFKWIKIISRDQQSRGGLWVCSHLSQQWICSKPQRGSLATLRPIERCSIPCIRQIDEVVKISQENIDVSITVMDYLPCITAICSSDRQI